MEPENETRASLSLHAETRQFVSVPAENDTPLSAYADVSHAKADVQMVTTTKDKLETYLSAGGSISSNFFALMVGSALTIFMALKSGGVEESWRPVFWLALIGSVILSVFFGFLTAKDEYKKYKYRKEIKKLPTTPLH
jgi:hypothetical protein